MGHPQLLTTWNSISPFQAAIPQNRLFSIFSASSLGRNESTRSSFRYDSDFSFPWDFSVFLWVKSFRQTFFFLLWSMFTVFFLSSSLVLGTYISKRTYYISLWWESLYLFFETDKVLYIISVLTTTFYNCFILPRCKTSPFWFWFSDFVTHHFKTSSLCSCHHQRWLTSMHQKFKVRNKQSNCSSFSYFTQNLPQVLSKICSSSDLPPEVKCFTYQMVNGT